MFKFIFLLFAIHFSTFPLMSQEGKKYTLSICALFRNEAKYLKEWIEYHRMVGVDHFYLYNNGSTDSFMPVLQPYIKENIVTLIDWSRFVGSRKEENTFMWSLGVQIPAYEHSINLLASRETKWMVFADINEFIVPPDANKLTDVLNKYENYPGVTLITDYFDASNITLPRRKLLIETVELTTAPEQRDQREVSKTIFKPDECLGFTWPPYACTFKNRQTAMKLRKREARINHYANRDAGFFHRGKPKELLHVDNRFLSDDEMTQLLSVGYEIEDQEKAIYRFLPQMLKKMGYDTGWNW